MTKNIDLIKKVNKLLVVAGFLLFFSSMFAPSVEAHSGRTDIHGCHHDHKYGGYHCHNGLSEKQKAERQAEIEQTQKILKGAFFYRKNCWCIIFNIVCNRWLNGIVGFY